MIDTATSDTDMMMTMGKSDDGKVRAPCSRRPCMFVCACEYVYACMAELKNNCWPLAVFSGKLPNS